MFSCAVKPVTLVLCWWRRKTMLNQSFNLYTADLSWRYMQIGGKNPPKPEVVIARQREYISTWSQRLQHSFGERPIHFHLRRHRQTMENTITYRPEVETVSRTGSADNLATETDSEAISMAIPIFVGGFTGIYAELTRRFLRPQIPRWRTEIVVTLRQKTIWTWSQRKLEVQIDPNQK